jgi:DNA-binding NtrC family response regulator
MAHLADDICRILLVDDDREVLRNIELYLESFHYQVKTAVTGLDALELLRSENYHVLVADIVMPDISGLGLIEIALREKPGLIIVAMTGYGQQVKDLTREKSPHYYLEKPFKLNQLSDVIESALQKS